ncbi:hypothetical protein ACJIZ3_011141 [Penstemon smallii]|uniref:Uncharacterized protein n=1 Tax=Penstemon smallii TaxID=265156 RepID=A0ABD3UIA7_9LAMI
MHAASPPLKNSSKQIEQLSFAQSIVFLSKDSIDASVAGTVTEELSSIDRCITKSTSSSFAKTV